MDKKILEWMFVGNTGMSSEAIAARMAGIDSGNISHPLDPSDLRRCVEFLEAVPAAKDRFEEMREVSPDWYRLVGVWKKLTTKLSEEMKNEDGRAPETYKMMKAVLKR